MRVARLARRITPYGGGQEQHVEKVAAAQSEQGVCNTVIFFQGRPAGQVSYQWIKTPNIARVPSDYGKGLVFSAEVVIYAVARRSVSAIDVVHSHGTAGDLWATLALKRKGVKCFHSFHGSLVFPWHVRRTYRALLPRLDGIFVVNDVIKEQLLELKIDLPEIYTFPSAIDPMLFNVLRRENPSRLVMVGRLAPVKGFDAGIRVAARLYRAGIITGVDIAGAGPDEALLRAIAQEEKLPVIFHGHLDKSGLARLFEKAALFLCPSRTLPGQAEGTPTSIMEAWAAGVPVVACASGGIPKLIRDGADGLLAMEDDIDILEQKSRQAIVMGRALTEPAKKRVAGYTWSCLAEQMVEIYRKHGAGR